jgi:hypothetical protein
MMVKPEVQDEGEEEEVPGGIKQALENINAQNLALMAQLTL